MTQEDKRSYRKTSVDMLRGLVIVLMALDHVRDFFTEARINPIDPAVTTWGLYVTRWVTHLCAPVFVMLVGTSAGFMMKRRSGSEMSNFLVTRGLWLIFIEFTVVNFGWQFSISGVGSQVILQVIWAIGVAMLALALLIHLPFRIQVAVAAVILLGHNLLNFVLPPATYQSPTTAWLWFENHGFDAFGPVFVLNAYPILPWIGVALLGYLLVRIYDWDAGRRHSFLIRAGLGAVAAFLVIRGLNFYGDPIPWTQQESLPRTIMSFFNAEKYPPSLSFLLITLGPMLIFLRYAEEWQGPIKTFLVPYGRVPFFFYVLHIYVIHLAAMAAAGIQGLDPTVWLTAFWTPPEGYGFPLFVVYVVWIAVVVAFYWPCKWFMRVKASSRARWLSYL